jgi:hypothetical protein
LYPDVRSRKACTFSNAAASLSASLSSSFIPSMICALGLVGAVDWYC